MYYIVEFQCNHTIAVISDKWLTGCSEPIAIDSTLRSCYWPKVTDRGRLHNLLQSRTLPLNGNKLFSVIILKATGNVSIMSVISETLAEAYALERKLAMGRSVSTDCTTECEKTPVKRTRYV